MAYSIVTHPGDGSTTTFAINFTLGFISRDDVQCRVGEEVDGLGDPVYRTLTWITDGLVEVQGDPAAEGVTIEFTRTVDKDQLIHDFTDGAAITESNLDDSHKQVLMLVHEFLDGRAYILPNADVDMNNQRVINIADGVNDQDAVTVSQAAQAVALTPIAVQAATDAQEAKTAAEIAAAAAEAAAEALDGAMLQAENLNDLADKVTARTNLDVYSKSESDGLARLPTTQVFNTPGTITYTPTPGTSFAKFDYCGAGGGGGGVSANNTAGGSGGAGGFASIILTATEIGASKDLTIGAGGAGGTSGASGSTGGTTSIGTLASCGGGGGGAGGAGAGNAGGAGGSVTITIGTILQTITGQAGGGSFTGTAMAIGGAGGSCPLGQGGAAKSIANASTVGNNGTGYGSGGAGAVRGSSGIADAGGTGTNGKIIVTEF